MDPWVIWLLLAVAFAVGEMATTSFFIGPFAIGALAAVVIDLAGLGWVVQVIVFMALSMASLATIRPIARRHLRTPPAIRTGTAALIGRTAMVIEGIDNDGNVGKVRLEGEIWTARALEDDGVIEVGKKVQVIEIRGATALVTE